MAAETIMQGTTLTVDTGGGHVAIGDIVDMNGPGASRTIIQIGAADSALSLNLQKAGRTTVGTWNFTVNYEVGSATQARIAELQMKVPSTTVNAAATDYEWKVNFSDDGDSVATFTGFASGFDIQGADDGVVTATISVSMQSAITFT